MKRTLWMRFAMVLLALHAIVPDALAGDAVTTEGLTSTKAHGVVKLVSDPTLSDGRLVLKVVAFNRTSLPSSFGPEDIKVFTAAGQPIAVMTLEQLVQETKTASGHSDKGGNTFHDPSSYSGPTLTHDSAGRPNVGNYTGAAGNNTGPLLSSRTSMDERARGDDKQLQQRIDALNAAILHAQSITAASAAGGQIVTEKIKFGRKDEHALRVVVDFNGEQHEFDFAAPPSR
ncbi:MAG: hypothetical protein JWN85_1399 [Gammaproteobacteria bacterium]|nr:hypothetical protein [Gammaproteobacteria bacterium]